MLKGITLQAYGTKATKAEAVKLNKDPEATFTAQVPVIPDWESPEAVLDWVDEYCCLDFVNHQKVNASRTLRDRFAIRVEKHLCDAHRRVYHTGGSTSAKIIIAFATHLFKEGKPEAAVTFTNLTPDQQRAVMYENADPMVLADA